MRDIKESIDRFKRTFSFRFRRGSLIRKRYRILRTLGVGKYGIAYLCQDIQQNRRCVLKRIAPQAFGNDQTEALFLSETELLKRLDHPAIPTFYDRFHVHHHRCFTMQFIEGDNLDRLLFQKQVLFTEKTALIVIKKLLHIVKHIHDQGIVHRDINIANVIVHRDDVRLIDFGMAREYHPSSDEETEPDDVNENDPSEKKIRRRIHVTSDFYAMGHLLLFLLYSSYKEENEAEEASWEEELTLHPQTKKLLRRLLLTEQPYEKADEIFYDVTNVLASL